MKEEILLVDVNDKELGYGEKMDVHINPRLHRAFSILIFNSKKEMLIHKRASSKYHSGGLWTNACCSHQRKGETLMQSAHRRLKEEMGFDCELKEVFEFVYKAKLEKNLYEYEYDHTMIGTYDSNEINFNTEEVEDFKWVTIDFLKSDIRKNPEIYTVWFKIIIEKYFEYKEVK